MTEKLLSIKTKDDFILKTHVIPAAEKPKGVIVYYHGGGLISGSPTDLNENVIKVLTQSFHLVLAPYRLAPESDFETIISDAFAVFDEIAELYSDLPIFTFGRSSGGYLAIQIAAHRKVKGILDFYGYSQIDLPEFRHEHEIFKRKTSKLTEPMIQLMLQSSPITSGPTQIRYPLYLYTRGNALWYEYVGIEDAAATFLNLSEAALKKLPPIFIAHAVNDIDVPYSEALRLHHSVVNSSLVSIPTDEHDFDRVMTPKVAEVYQKAVDFLIKLLN
ncbi:esterase/lipase-protein [Staphylococcus piscifermentans]|uniref:Alpha/beta hydrolase n=1 Tax=Staphylococcus piscifermentans TaxID=70258 RepID=A0A239TNC5_9STAP|nr:alpha/beta hydrolase [Staphylococcus piscifermentans]RTX86147.1 alpha/beta hydrolase [Staphylococcus piscifermentans]GEP84830.1 alpha/beta hydrolase [Staphylococcus piscifermentans]SNU98688.1 esterase/lipase-protein [Staphylococcus piscifermentans]